MALPSIDIGTVCADCGAAWEKTYEGYADVVFVETDEVLECDECEGEELTAELCEDEE